MFPNLAQFTIGSGSGWAEDKQNVRQRINSGDKETKVKQRAESGSSKTKQTKLNFKPVEKKPKRNPWSDVDSDEDKSGWMMDRLFFYDGFRVFFTPFNNFIIY